MSPIASYAAYWDREAIIAAIQAFARRHGRPPTAKEWSGPLRARRARPRGRPGYRRPHHTTVIARFGSWNAALAEAGLEPRPAHRPPSTRQRAKAAA